MTIDPPTTRFLHDKDMGHQAMVARHFFSLITPSLTTLVVLAVTLAGCDTSHAVRQPQAITIAAHDYAFVLPDSLRPGPTAFRLQNVGKVPHEAFVLLLKPGATMAQMFDVVKATGRPDSLVEATVGVLMAKPGLTAPGTLLTDLQPGRTYVLACTFADGPQKLPHFQLGMAASRTIVTP